MRNGSKVWWAPAAQNRMIGLVLVMVIFVTLIGAPASITTPSVGPILFEGFAILLLATLFWRTRWNLSLASLRTFARSGPNLPILAFLGLALLSCLFSHNRTVSVQDTLMLASGILLYFVVAYQFRRSEQLKRLVDVLVLVAIAGAVLGCAEYSSHPDQPATGLFGDHQLFGSFLMILLPFSAVSAITDKVLNRQLAAQTAAVLSLIALMLAHSRSAWIGTAVGLVVVGALLAFGVKRGARPKGWKQEILFPVALILLGVGFFVCLTPMAGSFLQRADTLTHVAGDSAWQDRQVTWRGALRMIRERPFMGLGPGLYPYYHYDYAGTGLPIRSLHLKPSLSNEAHNLYLQTAAEIGAPGAAALLAVLASFWIAGLRRVRAMDVGLRRNLLIGSLGATTAFAVDAFASPSWQFGQILMFFWLALGIGVTCMTPVVGNSEDFLDAAPPASERFRRRAIALASLGLAALLPTAVMATTNIYYSTCDHIVVTPATYTNANAGQQYLFQAFIYLTPTVNGGPITLDSHTTWTENGKGTMVALPGPQPGNNGDATLDYEAYNSVAADAKNHTVKITATYVGGQKCSATATIDFDKTGG